MKKKLIACLCMISMLASNVMPVFAEGTDSETTTTPVLESVSVVTEPESDRDLYGGCLICPLCRWRVYGQ